MNVADMLCDQKVIAILRGVTPENIHQVCESLVIAGVKAVEVPLNSPFALQSIQIIAEHFANELVFGAGTVVNTEQVDNVKRAGGQFIVSPNTDSRVISQALNNNLVPIPGIATPSEAFLAIESGAKLLKVFPANALGRDFVKAIKTVLPSDIHLFAVGQVDLNNINGWLAAGCTGVGIGSQLFNPTDSQHQWQEKCRLLSTFLTSNKIGQHAKL